MNTVCSMMMQAVTTTYPDMSEATKKMKKFAKKKGIPVVDFKCSDREPAALEGVPSVGSGIAPFRSFTEWMKFKEANHTDPDWHLCRPRTKSGLNERLRRDREIELVLTKIEDEVIKSAERIASLMGRIRKNL